MRARTRATRSPADSRHVLGYIARLSWMRQLALVALVLVGVACSLAPIQLFRTILDRAIPSRDLVLVAKLAAGLALVTTLGAVATYWRNLMSDRIRQTFLAEFRGSLFAHLLRASPDFFSRQSLGELMNKAQLDVGRLAMTVTAILVDPIVSGATLLIYVGYLLTLSPALTALALASLPVLALAVPALNRRLAANARHFTREIGAFAGAMSESFAGIFEIQVHATYGYTEARVARGEDTVGDVRRDEARLGGWLQALSDLARGAGPILVYGYGAVLAIRGSMQVGEIVAFASTLGGLYGALDKLIKYPPLVTNAQDRFRELLELFRTPCVFLDDGEVVPADGTISLSRVAFAYDERSPVLRDVSLEVPRGEHVALVGRSGCGKSSVLGLIAGRLRPGRGNVRLGGLEIGELAAGEVARAFGVVGQTPFLFNGTLRDNLLYGLLRERDGDVGEARSFLDLAALGLGARPSPDAIDARLVAVCEEVSLRDDLYELGLAAFVAPERAAGLLAIRGRLRDVFRDDPEVEHFDPDRYLTASTVGENLAFAPRVDTATAGARATEEWIRAVEASGLGLVALLARIGHGHALADLDFLRRVGERNPSLLAELGTDEAEVRERVRLVDAVAGRPIDPGPLGGELTRGLVRRGLAARESDPARRTELVAARAAFSAALGPNAPRPYDPGCWHPALGVRDNLIFGHVDASHLSTTRRVNAALAQALEAAGSIDLVLRLGLDFAVGERGAKLSGGQRQKVSIARVFLKEPMVLLLDEATSALDERSARHVQQAVRAHFRGRTVVAVTHRLGELEPFDRVVVFEQGAVAEDGAPHVLLAGDGALARLRQSASGG